MRGEIPKKDKLRKIRKVNDDLIKFVQMAFNPEQDFAIDESMIALCSKFCPFRQLMKSKPIKCGVKVFWCRDTFSGLPFFLKVILHKHSETITWKAIFTASDANGTG